MWQAFTLKLKNGLYSAYDNVMMMWSVTTFHMTKLVVKKGYRSQGVATCGRGKWRNSGLGRELFPSSESALIVAG